MHVHGVHGGRRREVLMPLAARSQSAHLPVLVGVGLVHLAEAAVVLVDVGVTPSAVHLVVHRQRRLLLELSLGYIVIR